MTKPEHDPGQLEDIDEMSRRLRMSPTTIRRRVRTDPIFPQPVLRGGRSLWRTVDRIAYVELLAKQRDELRAKRGQREHEQDRPAA